ncbi:MAG: hypothetical protein JO357_17970, partial [Hyphomicrobiales bacterium]|nr:hypothetical protein [Hyphomicrobiales bacterium]
MSDKLLIVRGELGIELDHRMTFVRVVRGYARGQRQVIAEMGDGKILDPAADMDPRAELHVLQQCLVGETQELSGMDE